MKKFLFLFFICFGLTFQVQAYVVEMTKENTKAYKDMDKDNNNPWKEPNTDISICNFESRSLLVKLRGNMGSSGNVFNIESWRFTILYINFVKFYDSIQVLNMTNKPLFARSKKGFIIIFFIRNIITDILKIKSC